MVYIMHTLLDIPLFTILFIKQGEEFLMRVFILVLLSLCLISIKGIPFYLLTEVKTYNYIAIRHALL
jgi:hypothetical protein